MPRCRGERTGGAPGASSRCRCYLPLASDAAEREKVLGRILGTLDELRNAPGQEPAAWVAGSPLVEVTFALFGDRDLPLVEGHVAAVVLADPVDGGRVGVGVAPRRVVMDGADDRDVVVLGVALPRAGVRRRAVAERPGAERGRREIEVAFDGDHVRLRSAGDDLAVDRGLHALFPSSGRCV